MADVTLTDDEMKEAAKRVLDAEELRIWDALTLPGMDDVLFSVTVKVRGKAEMKKLYTGIIPAELEARERAASTALAASGRYVQPGIVRALMARLILSRVAAEKAT